MGFVTLYITKENQKSKDFHQRLCIVCWNVRLRSFEKRQKKEWNTIISAQLQLEAKFSEQREFKLNFQLHFSPMAHTFICLICNFVCSIFWNACMTGTVFPYQTILTIKWMRCICLKIFVRFYTVLGLVLVRSGFAIHFHLIFNGKIICAGRANSRSWFDCKCAKPIEQKQPVLHYNTSTSLSLSLPIGMQRDDHHKDHHFKRMSYFLFRTGWIRMLLLQKYSNSKIKKNSNNRETEKKTTPNSIRSGSISKHSIARILESNERWEIK